MSYLKTYHLLKNSFDFQKELITLPGQNFEIYNLPFESDSDLIFPGGQEYYVPQLQTMNCTEMIEEKIKSGNLREILKVSDSEVIENKSFRYVFLKQKTGQKSKGIIIMFHGLNEKDWTKYLPWANKLMELTQKDVILFPIAFHINRALVNWSNPRLMDKISKERQGIFNALQESSFTNAATSARLHFVPSRFFLSGLETYNDIIQLVTKIKMGNHSMIDKNASIDLFGYSAGAFLAQILLMANRNGIFSQSKGILFCGGTLLSRMQLTSRYIMDNEAHQAINRFYIDNLDTHLEKDSYLNLLFSAATSGGLYFRTMLSQKDAAANEVRESRLKQISNQLLGISLKKDSVMFPHDIEDTLKGSKKDIPTLCRTFDFEYDYSHVNPFPAIEKIEPEVEKAFQEVFETIANFL